MSEAPYRLHQPGTIEEIAEVVAGAAKLAFGVGRTTAFLPHNPFTEAQGALISGKRAGAEDQAALNVLLDYDHLDFSNYSGIVEWYPDDQVVVVRRGSLVGGFGVREGQFRLQEELATRGQCLPLPHVNEPSGWMLQGYNLAVGNGLMLNLPHALEAQCGNWRDWILGMRFVTAEGTIVKSGSRAVKNVAGYDIHKFLVGSQDSLVVACDLILRTFPLAALPEPDLVRGRPVEASAPFWVRRVRRSDFEAAVAQAGESLIYADRRACTLWQSAEADPARFPGEWRAGFGVAGDPPEPTQLALWRRAKAVLDPNGKLNPGGPADA